MARRSAICWWRESRYRSPPVLGDWCADRGRTGQGARRWNRAPGSQTRERDGDSRWTGEDPGFARPSESRGTSRLWRAAGDAGRNLGRAAAWYRGTCPQNRRPVPPSITARISSRWASFFMNWPQVVGRFAATRRRRHSRPSSRTIPTTRFDQSAASSTVCARRGEVSGQEARRSVRVTRDLAHDLRDLVHDSSAVSASRFRPGRQASHVGVARSLPPLGLTCWLTAWLIFRSPADDKSPAHDIRRIVAVLPFKDLTGDPSQAYFAAGVTEEIRRQLSRLVALRLIQPRRGTVQRRG